jgi:ankyrin repeat protein
MRTRKHARKLKRSKQSRRSKFLQRGGSGDKIPGEACTKSWGFDNCIYGSSCVDGVCKLPENISFIIDRVKRGNMYDLDDFGNTRRPLNSNGDTLLHLIFTSGLPVAIGSNLSDIFLSVITVPEPDPNTFRQLCKLSDVNAKNKDGETPLLKACVMGCSEPAKILIENGADVNTRTNDSLTILHHIANEAAKWSPEVTSEWNRYYHAKRKEVLPLLFKAGINVDAQNDKGHTFLHNVVLRSEYEGMSDIERLARENEQTELVQIILNKKANVNLQDELGCIPLHYAFYNSHVVKLLLAAGSNTAIANKNGWTPLQLLKFQPHVNPECIRLLSETEENL